MSRRNEKIAQGVPPHQSSEWMTLQEFCTFAPRAVGRQALRIREYQPPCVLCGHPFYALELFVPDQPQRWGFPEGWYGARPCGMCQACMVLPDKVARVKAALWQQRAQMAAPWN
jgi:hypothetical protein